MLPQLNDGCRLYLLRHPELDGSADGIAIGGGDARLGHRGRSTMVRWLKQFERLALDAVYTSPQSQSRDPASALALAKGLEAQEDDRLRDQDLGRWQGSSWEALAHGEPDKVRSFFSDFGEIQAPEGESLGQSIERFLEWWYEVRAESLRKHVAVVTTGSMIGGFAAAMLGMRLSRAVALQLPHGALGVLDMFENGARISCWNAGALGDEDTEDDRRRAAEEAEDAEVDSDSGDEPDGFDDIPPGRSFS